MMRTYKRKPGARPYAMTYSSATLATAVRLVKSGVMSRRKASVKFKIPFGTLNNKVSGKHAGKCGTPTRLSPVTELRLVKAINILATWKVPLSSYVRW